ncbi:MAG: right-handed parallel beta-helix repeat-containing protein [Rhizobacter sp.]|nr:right-handed parallel beta-helix repeat-containing protein [Rhizobacter sp.]
MAADLSRIRHNPLLNYAGVLLQQGRVLLDADFNELVDVLDRRLRASASDVLGRATVSSTTPDAFRITSQAGSLRIGIGRLYVDGLLAENHGGPSDDPAQKRFDPLLSEVSFPDPLTYATQPFLSAPPALPTAGVHLVYLDVWDREVTVLEEPGLSEVALGTVDTSARRQTVWQVRVLPDDAGAAGCATDDEDVPGWAAVTAPSVARLSTGTYDAPAATDPCELPPTGGYRGLENQTYRIEVHDPGLPAAGGATFKWSRDNASVASRVASVISSTQLELASLGRDEVLRFNTGDWVEICDDLGEQAQTSGLMRSITVDEAARAIEFAPPLPAAMLARPLRVRRWDQAHEVLRVNANGTTSVYQDLDADDSGVIAVPPAGTTLLLEKGITVSFGVAAGAGRFRAGDHWVVAARTADASVELLANEPPRGIHHHYARLGFWNVATGEVSDCRHPWPPVGGGDNCACTECVTPESHASGELTLQAAVDRAIERGGGTVCLAIGQYMLDEPVRVTNARSLRIRGEGAGTLLVARGVGALRLSGGMAVAVEDLAAISAVAGDVLHAENMLGLSLQRLVLASLSPNDRSAAIGLSRAVLSATLRDNVIAAPLGIAAGVFTAPPTGAAATRTGVLLSGALRVEDNLLVCRESAIDLSGLALHLLSNQITGNDITGCREDAIRLLGLCGPGGAMRVCDNVLSVHGNGITAGVDGLWIEGNKLRATRASGSQAATGVGIQIETGLDSGGPNECQLLANQVRGFEGGGIMVARAGDLIIKLNILADCGYGIWLQDESPSARVSIENNHLDGIGRGGRLVSTVGIAVTRADVAAVSGNTLTNVGREGDSALMVVGIFATGVEQLRVSGNSLADIGPPGSFDRGYSVGVLVGAPFVNADVSHNQVERESIPLTAATGRFVAVWVADAAAAMRGNAIGAASGYMTATAGTTTLVFGRRRVYTRGRFAAAAAAGNLRSNAGVQGNTLGSRGTLPAVRVDVDGDCLFSNNRCEWRSSGPVAVQLASGASIVSANRVRGGETSIQIGGNDKSVTVLGNITTGNIRIGTAGLGPWAALNVRG